MRVVKYYLLNNWYLLRNTEIYTVLVYFGIYLYVGSIKNASGGGVKVFWRFQAQSALRAISDSSSEERSRSRQREADSITSSEMRMM